jgi:type IV pilus assembly protein PilB
MPSRESKRLGETLVHEKLLTREELEDSLREQETSGDRLGAILVRRGFVEEHALAEIIAKEFSLPFVSPDQYYISSDLFDLFPIEMLEKYEFVPLDRLGKVLTVATTDVPDKKVLEHIQETSGCTVRIFIAPISQIHKAIEKIETHEKDKVAPVAPAPPVAETPERKTDIEILRELAEELKRKSAPREQGQSPA